MDDVKLDGPVDILVTLGLTLPSISETEIDDIRAAAPPGSTVRVAPTMKEAIATAGDAEVIFGFIPKPLFDAAPKLRWVHCIASGMDMFLYPDMQASSVVLTGEKGLVGGHLADTGFGLLLALTRRSRRRSASGPRHGAGGRRCGWSRSSSRGERWASSASAGRAGRWRGGRSRSAWTCIACDVVAVPPSDGVTEVWSMARLDDLLGASDVVAVGAPLTAETRGLFDDERFAAMKPGALLVNVTRGEIVDGDALVTALRSGNLGGAALDVAPIEPLPADHPLWTFDNVVMTPHTAGASQLRGPRNIRRFCENLRRAQRGDALLGVVDKDLGY